jgi:hypothetical protein
MIRDRLKQWLPQPRIKSWSPPNGAIPSKANVPIRRRHHRIRPLHQQEQEPIFDDVIYCEGRDEGIFVEVAMQYNDGYAPQRLFVCNNSTPTKAAPTKRLPHRHDRVLNAYARDNKI